MRFSVTFIVEKNNRKWTYDNVGYFELKRTSVFIHARDGFKTYVQYTEFDRIEIEKEQE